MCRVHQSRAGVVLSVFPCEIFFRLLALRPRSSNSQLFVVVRHLRRADGDPLLGHHEDALLARFNLLELGEHVVTREDLPKHGILLVEVRGRRRGGMGCGNSKARSMPEPGSVAFGNQPDAERAEKVAEKAAAEKAAAEKAEAEAEMRAAMPSADDECSTAASKALEAAVKAYGIAPGPPEAQALALAQKGLWPESWDGGETWHEEGNKEKALPAALVEAELAAKAAVEAQNLEKFGTTVPNSDAAARYSHASWVEVPSALPEDTAPSARLGAQGSARSYCRTQSAA